MKAVRAVETKAPNPHDSVHCGIESAGLTTLAGARGF